MHKGFLFTIIIVASVLGFQRCSNWVDLKSEQELAIKYDNFCINAVATGAECIGYGDWLGQYEQ